MSAAAPNPLPMSAIRIFHRSIIPISEISTWIMGAFRDKSLGKRTGLQATHTFSLQHSWICLCALQIGGASLPIGAQMV